MNKGAFKQLQLEDREERQAGASRQPGCCRRHGLGSIGRAALHRAAHRAVLYWGQDGGKQMGRKRTFPGVRFSWKGACLELTSHGTKQQRLRNRLKNVFSSRPVKLQDGCVLFCIGCFYVVLLAQWASPLLRGDFKSIPSHIFTHILVQVEGANRSTTLHQPFSPYR